MKKITIIAPAKVNLYLDILGTDQKNYHLLRSVMHSISLADTVTIEVAPQGGVTVSSSWEHIPMGQSNIVYQAAIAFYKQVGITPEGLNIHLEKAIPDQGGLGGGSSDGAGVLVGLNQLYGTKLTTKELCAIGINIGADLPFCLVGGCALVEGIGEKITPLPPFAAGYFVIVKPLQGVSTAEAFRQFDRLPEAEKTPQSSRGQVISHFTGGDLLQLGQTMGNVFERAQTTLPTEYFKEKLLSYGAVGACLSGSGSAVVGLFTEEQQAKDCTALFRQDQNNFVYLAKPVAYGAKIED